MEKSNGVIIALVGLCLSLILIFGTYSYSTSKQLETLNARMQSLSVETKSAAQVVEVAMPNETNTPAIEISELVKQSANDFTFLVSAPKWNGEWTVVLNNPINNHGFSFQYPRSSPWEQIRYQFSDLTATDGARSFAALKAIGQYRFCAGEYYCDDQKRDGMGFTLTIWNASYEGKDKKPEFYLEEGNILLTQTDKYIITYKPFSSTDTKVKTEVESLMKTFTTLQSK